MDFLQSVPPPRLDACDRNRLLDYFSASWQLEEVLMESLAGEDTFYLNPDRLRNPLIFYLGHSASFYINKLIQVGLIQQPINPEYEILFAFGVDPSTPTELNEAIQNIRWPQVEDVRQYRNTVKAEVTAVIEHTPLDSPIDQEHPLWALMMGMEHNRIHFETSSMLIRQLSPEHVARPSGWHYASSGDNKGLQNEMVSVPGGIAELGKAIDAPTYGWDSEYGHRTVDVRPFLASQYLITNGEFLQFVQDGGYENPEVWDDAAWAWKTTDHITHPKFWIAHNGHYQYRAMFDEMDLPLDWPVEVNHHEAMAYCRWKGKDIRLMTEAEWNIAHGHSTNGSHYNLDLCYGSPTPVGQMETASSSSGLYDLRGNVWEWLSDSFNPLPGFKPHPLYADYSAPYFDTQHKLMLGGAWASTGAYAAPTCRNWFRRNFYQHAGFRIAQTL